MYLFKQDLQALVDEIGVEIRIAHYPPYTSKYNPIEHRLFPHITRFCQGVIFDSVQMVKDLMVKTKTQTGLKVFVSMLDKIYATGRKVTQEFSKLWKLCLTITCGNGITQPSHQCNICGAYLIHDPKRMVLS